MARRKRKKDKIERYSFKKSASRQRINLNMSSLMGILKVLVIVIVFAAIGAAFYFAQQYVKSAKPVETGPLVLEDVPEWVNSELKTRIFAAANYKYLELDEKAARLVADNLSSVGWLDDLRVLTTHDSIRISGRWRKPLALVKSGFSKFYVDDERVVLEFVPIPNLPVVRIKGVSVTKVPPVGQVFDRDDLNAAVTVLAALDKMDKSVTPEKPLLNEIDSIDMSNFKGRRNNSQSHIILYAKDSTEIIWGAEFGTWQKHLEATDEEKLAKLYGYYKEYGSLSGGARYINLRDPQNNVPLPIDKY